MKYDISVKCSYPTFCYGEWIITINGIKLEGLDTNNFNTYGTYQQWKFVNWIEVETGSTQPEWIEYAKKENPNKLITALQNAGFEVTDELLGQLYGGINSCDWIHGSCGGCI